LANICSGWGVEVEGLRELKAQFSSDKLKAPLREQIEADLVIVGFNQNAFSRREAIPELTFNFNLTTSS